jgi:hypothetical protein
MLLLKMPRADCFTHLPEPLLPFGSPTPTRGDGAAIYYDEPVIWRKSFRSEVSKQLPS